MEKEVKKLLTKLVGLLEAAIDLAKVYNLEDKEWYHKAVSTISKKLK